MTPRPIHGRLLVLTGAAHVVFSLLPFVYGKQWLQFVREGFINALPHGFPPAALITDHLREAAFWFLLAGVLLVILGDLMHRIEEREGAVPRRAVWATVGLSVVTTLMMPISAFSVVLLPQALFMLWRQAKIGRSAARAT